MSIRLKPAFKDKHDFSKLVTGGCPTFYTAMLERTEKKLVLGQGISLKRTKSLLP